MKKIICGLLAAVSLLALLSGCGKPIKEPPQIGFLVGSQFSGYRVGIVNSLNSEDEVVKEIGSPEIVKFSSVSKGLSSLRNDKIHGLVLPAAYAEEALKKHSDISKLYVPFIEKKISGISTYQNEFAFGVNAAITFIQNNGMAKQIASTHAGNGNSVRPAEYDKIEGRVLRVGVSSADGAPLCYKDKKGELCGINIDTAYACAEKIRAELVISDYENEEALTKAIDANEIDLALSDFVDSTDNPLTLKYHFTHPYADISTHILIKGETPKVATEGLSALGK